MLAAVYEFQVPMITVLTAIAVGSVLLLAVGGIAWLILRKALQIPGPQK